MSSRLHDFVTERAQRCPDALAVVLGSSQLTYGELDDQSTQLARQLVDAGCRRGDRVCLLASKSTAALAAIVGIYKADCTYVPLDPSSPAARLFKIVDACEPAVVLLTAGSAALADDIAALGLSTTPLYGAIDAATGTGSRVVPAFTAADVSRQPVTPLEGKNGAGDPAHILFTSGSTGQPKGVLITHASVGHFIEWANAYFDVQAGDRVSGHSPLAFDLSIYDIFGAFAAGACLYPVPPELNVFPNKLTDFIRSHALTQWFSAPSVLSYLAQLDAIAPGDFPALKRVIWCGEVFPTPALRYWMTRIPHASFTNLYGPTETTIASSYFAVTACPSQDTATIPIGTACPGEALYVLNEDRQPAPAGAIGEIYIGGVGLSPGYWRAPDLTGQVFVQHPRSADPADRIYRTGDLGRVGDDGLVHFIGRRDSQIKSRGHRIELGEIETALQKLPELRDSAVVAVPTEGFGGTVVCCAYVARPGSEVTPAVLRKQLAALVPPYMLPLHWKAFDRLPLNGNGKTDRNQLKQTFAEGDVGRALAR